ncbi:MAG: cellulase family glycosylhydrolase [Bdellovibrionales bacterium]
MKNTIALVFAAIFCAVISNSAMAATPVSIVASGDKANNVYPQMVVYADGQKITTVSVTAARSSNSWQTVSLSLASYPQKMAIAFTNDGGSGGQNRNLYIQTLTVNGVSYSPTQAVYDRGSYTWTMTSNTMAGQGAMYWNGKLVFTIQPPANTTINGTCGSSSGSSFTSAPATNLCSAGSASTVSGSGPWSWSCNGSNGGSSASCSATLRINAACGSSNGASFASKPTTDLCSAGNASAVSGSGPWTWSCAGINGGSNVSCSAKLIVNGMCGAAAGTGSTTRPSNNLCSQGTASSVSGRSPGPYTWTCRGSNGGTNASCTTKKATNVVNGACGSSNGMTFSSKPTTNLCSLGTASAVAGTGPWSWSCAGSGGGTSASCTALIPETSGAPLMLPTGYLSTSGNQFVDAAGNNVRIAGVGWNQVIGDIPSQVAQMKAMGFNAIRISWVNATVDADLALNDQIVAAARTHGLKVILDNHTNEPGHGPEDNWGAQQKNGLWYDVGGVSDGTDGGGNTGTVTDAKFLSDWVKVAQHYAGNDTVIGYDIRNEPLAYGGMCTWGDGNINTDIRLMYQRVGNAIQAVDPHKLIIVEGPQNYSETFIHSGIAPEGDLTLAATKPVVLNVPNKVVYSIHEYPNSIAGINCCTSESGQIAIDRMNNAWGYLVKQNIAPVWIGEMGASMDNNGDRAWADTMVAYVNGTANNGPRFTGTQQPISTNWWVWGYLPGQLPNGTLQSNGTPRPEQKVITDQLRYYQRQ